MTSNIQFREGQIWYSHNSVEAQFRAGVARGRVDAREEYRDALEQVYHRRRIERLFAFCIGLSLGAAAATAAAIALWP